MSALSPKSYRCLEWNFEVGRNHSDPDDDIFSRDTYASPVKVNARKTTYHYDQSPTEDKYRKVDMIDFRFNPKNYSIDCEHAAQRIHRKLLIIVGSDVIQVNNPAYFDLVGTRTENIHRQNVLIAEKAREKKELQRSQAENFYLSKHNMLDTLKERENRMKLKFYETSKNISRNECASFSFEDSTCCITQITSDDTLPQKKEYQKKDSLDDVKEIKDIYGEVNQYIQDVLVLPEVEQPRHSVRATPEGVIKPPLYHSVTPIVERKEEKLPKITAKEKVIVVKKDTKDSKDSKESKEMKDTTKETTKPTTCGCGKKK